jgi:hypothetical protein
VSPEDKIKASVDILTTLRSIYRVDDPDGCPGFAEAVDAAVRKAEAMARDAAKEWTKGWPGQ